MNDGNNEKASSEVENASGFKEETGFKTGLRTLFGCIFFFIGMGVLAFGILAYSRVGILPVAAGVFLSITGINLLLKV